MGWAEAIAAIFKVVGFVLDAKAKGTLTQAALDAAIAHLVPPPPPAPPPPR
jgi:hypothetical protein